MNTQNEVHSVNRLSEITGRDRRTIKHHLEGVRPTKTENGRKLYRLSDVEHLAKERPQPRPYRENSEAHWLRELTTKVILAGGAIEEVFAEYQKIKSFMKRLGEENGLERQIVEEDLNRTSDVYGKPIAELLLFGAVGGKKITERVIDLWFAWNSLAQPFFDIDGSLQITGFFSTQIGRELKRVALNDRRKKKGVSKFPLSGGLLKSLPPEEPPQGPAFSEMRKSQK